MRTPPPPPFPQPAPLSVPIRGAPSSSQSIRLMTNNPFKINWMKATGVEVSGRIPVQVASNKHNVGYLEAKADRMSHLINNL